jgi:histidine triad (HIT) family protein
MSECIFCRIVSGDVPAAKVAEDDRALSFLDISPVNPGHCLVVPRRHVADYLELREDELGAMAALAQCVARAACEVTGSPAFNLLLNRGAPAGQVVPHAHLHVIPRSEDDGFSFGWRQLDYQEGELDRLQAAIRERL